MKQIRFYEGVVLALLLSTLVAASFVVLGGYFLGSDILRLALAVTVFIYITYLLIRSNQKTGRLSVLLLGAIVTAASFILVDSFMMFAFIQLLMIWLVRSLYFYQNIFQSMADGLLIVVALLVSGWAWLSTGSVFLSVWCFFLFQALFIHIPRNLSLKKDSQPGFVKEEVVSDQFERAYQMAELASEKLIKTGS